MENRKGEDFEQTVLLAFLQQPGRGKQLGGVDGVLYVWEDWVFYHSVPDKESWLSKLIQFPRKE